MEMEDLSMEDLDHVAGGTMLGAALGAVASFAAGKAIDSILGATWGSGGIGHMSDVIAA